MLRICETEKEKRREDENKKMFADALIGKEKHAKVFTKIGFSKNEILLDKIQIAEVSDTTGDATKN